MIDHRRVRAEHVEHGDHGCLLYDHDEQWEHAVSRFVGEGLRRGEQVQYFADAYRPERIREMLLGRDVRIDPALASGQLSLLTATQTYLADLPFDPDRMMSDLRAAIEGARVAGYAGYRVIGDMCWAQPAVPGADWLLDYERQVGSVFTGRPASAMCLYDTRRFASGAEDFCEVHPVQIVSSPARGWMSGSEREHALVEVFVELADTLVADFDVIDLLYRLTAVCVDVLGVDGAGVVLTNPGGKLESVAASDDRTWALELLQVREDEGPGPECFRAAAPVSETNLASADLRWPRFAGQARQNGFGSVCALPLRLRGHAIGSLNLYTTEPGGQSDRLVRTAQALADTMTIGILQARGILQGEVLNEQLQTALTGRIDIEQAKGSLARYGGISPEAAFAMLRRYARTQKLRLSDLARAVVRDEIDLDALLRR